MLENIKKIGKACKDKGVVLLYHNHDFEFVKIGDVYGLDYIYNEIPADILQTELDCCWVKVSGEAPVPTSQILYNQAILYLHRNSEEWRYMER